MQFADKPNIYVAPMLDWTDRHCRYFMRLISPNVILFSEMITTGAILFGNTDKHLKFNEIENPVILQLGGSDPDQLAKAAKLSVPYGYAGINLNCGCPSDRVKNGNFGASLMAQPDLVERCLKAMKESVNLPISIKCRIGIDDCDDYLFLKEFISHVENSGCTQIFIHARKAWLNGLSPKENRTIPPIRYDIVKKIKSEFPHLNIILNGEIKTISDIQSALKTFDGVMIGRQAYQNPYFLADIEKEIFSNSQVLSRNQVATLMVKYINTEIDTHQTRPHSITRHILGLYKGKPGGAIWRRELSNSSNHLLNNNGEIIINALTKMEPLQRAHATN